MARSRSPITTVTTRDPVGHALFGDEHQDGYGCVAQPQAPADLQPIDTWQHHVEHDNFRRPVEGHAEGSFTVGGHIN